MRENFTYGSARGLVVMSSTRQQKENI